MLLGHFVGCPLVSGKGMFISSRVQNSKWVSKAPYPCARSLAECGSWLPSVASSLSSVFRGLPAGHWALRRRESRGWVQVPGQAAELLSKGGQLCSPASAWHQAPPRDGERERRGGRQNPLTLLVLWSRCRSFLPAQAWRGPWKPSQDWGLWDPLSAGP